MPHERRLPFQESQYAFAACIRDPKRLPPKGIDRRRMGLYAELIFNGLDDQLSAIFPVLRSLLDEQHWHSLLRDYLIRHRARTPLFTRIGREFVSYLEQEREPTAEDPPYLAELAYFEYAELAVAISDDEPDFLSFDPEGDLLAGHPVLTPTAWNLALRYPVHTISSDHPDPAPVDTALVIYRDRDDQVRVLEVNPVTQRLLVLIRHQPGASGRHLLERIAGELRHPRPAAVCRYGADLLRDLQCKGLVLGSTSVPAD